MPEIHFSHNKKSGDNGGKWVLLWAGSIIFQTALKYWKMPILSSRMIMRYIKWVLFASLSGRLNLLGKPCSKFWRYTARRVLKRVLRERFYSLVTSLVLLTIPRYGFLCWKSATPRSAYMTRTKLTKWYFLFATVSFLHLLFLKRLCKASLMKRKANGIKTAEGEIETLLGFYYTNF